MLRKLAKELLALCRNTKKTTKLLAHVHTYTYINVCIYIMHKYILFHVAIKANSTLTSFMQIQSFIVAFASYWPSQHKKMYQACINQGKRCLPDKKGCELILRQLAPGRNEKCKPWKAKSATAKCHCLLLLSLWGLFRQCKRRTACHTCEVLPADPLALQQGNGDLG